MIAFRPYAGLFAGVALLPCVPSVAAARPTGNPNVPQPAKPVEFSRYAGRWYEIARYESLIQQDCEGVTVDYAKGADGLIHVTNTCRKGAPNGPVRKAEGRGRALPGGGGAKFEVSFLAPLKSEFWVIDRGDDYSWAIVGDRAGRQMWLLSRTPRPDGAALIARAKALGYDVSRLRMTAQPPG